MFYTYILKSQKNSSYYVGSCKNIKQRVNMHNQGFVKSTKHALPWILIYSRFFKNRNEARLEESRIKKLKKRVAIEKLILNS